jgi:adenine C2-methylase RlmN of 23S rRNA A2503 and tRNA A37
VCNGHKALVTGYLQIPWNLIKYTYYHRKDRQQMTTKREYLASKGITVGRRGRFSAAAKQALSEAEKNGIKFTAEVKQAKN